MIDTDYPIEALDILLEKICLSEKYYPLLNHKDALISGLQCRGCAKKSDAEALPDDAYIQMGLNDAKLLRLFRRFLALYDPNPGKFREIANIAPDPERQAAFQELYYLPGVKQIRASLYYLSGYRALKDFGLASVDEVLKKTSLAISANDLSCIVPLPKEVRTHIAVARAFTMKYDQ